MRLFSVPPIYTAGASKLALLIRGGTAGVKRSGASAPDI